ncbi:MAG: hypothetical protein ACTIA6_17140 [Pseudoclavibacter sp.]
MDRLEQKQEEANRALDWLSRKWGGLKQCPICKETDWSIGFTVELREFQGGDFVIGSGSIFPVTPVACTTCGYTLLINAVMSGAVAPEEDSPSVADGSTPGGI